MGPRFDDEVLTLARALRRRGAAVQYLDFTGLPGAHSLEIVDDEVRYDGRGLAALQALYLRRYRLPLADDPFITAAADESQWSAAYAERARTLLTERELGALIWSALTLLDRPLINDLEAQLVHPRKVHQLRALAAADLPVPETLASNDPAAIQAFVAALGPDNIVVKPIRGFLKTRRFDPAEVLPLTTRPVMLQRYVRGTTVRVYAVAGEVVAAGALRNQGHVDSSVEPLPVTLVELTAAERELVRRATRATSLPFTGMDLLRPEGGGGSWVLECNAAPMFANFCRRTGADVAGPLAEYLIDRALGGAVWK